MSTGEAKGNSPKTKAFALTLCALLFALCVSAMAQQPTKVPRIGFLIASNPSPVSALETFRQGVWNFEFRYYSSRFVPNFDIRILPITSRRTDWQVGLEVIHE